MPPSVQSLLCLLEQKHLPGWPGQSCLQLPGSHQAAAAFRAHRQVAQRGGSGVMGEGCDFSGHKGVLTEDLGTGQAGPLAFRVDGLNGWWRRSGVSSVCVEKLQKGPLQAEVYKTQRDTVLSL